MDDSVVTRGCYSFRQRNLYLIHFYSFKIIMRSIIPVMLTLCCLTHLSKGEKNVQVIGKYLYLLDGDQFLTLSEANKSCRSVNMEPIDMSKLNPAKDILNRTIDGRGVYWFKYFSYPAEHQHSHDWPVMGSSKKSLLDIEDKAHVACQMDISKPQMLTNLIEMLIEDDPTLKEFKSNLQFYESPLISSLTLFFTITAILLMILLSIFLASLNKRVLKLICENNQLISIYLTTPGTKVKITRDNDFNFPCDKISSRTLSREHQAPQMTTPENAYVVPLPERRC